MFIPALVLQLEGWMQWIASNWTVLVVMLGMVGFLALLLLLALAPDPPTDGDDKAKPGEEHRRQDTKRDPSPPR